MMIDFGLPHLVLAPEVYPTIVMAGRSFRMTVGDLDTSHFQENAFVSQTVIYTDIENAKHYTVEAYAYEINDKASGAIIPRFLYINGQLISAYHWQKGLDNNPLFYRLTGSIDALYAALAHAESLVKHMAFNQSIGV